MDGRVEVLSDLDELQLLINYFLLYFLIFVELIIIFFILQRILIIPIKELYLLIIADVEDSEYSQLDQELDNEDITDLM